MKILVKRLFQTQKTTISSVLVDGDIQCFGLENTYNQPKIPGNTRIPCGTYRVGLRTVGGEHRKYLKRFPNIHKGMLHIKDVPGFEHILIHIGNFHEETDGCLLLGQNIAHREGEGYMVANSKVAYKEFYANVISAARDGILKIDIRDDGLFC